VTEIILRQRRLERSAKRVHQLRVRRWPVGALRGVRVLRAERVETLRPAVALPGRRSGRFGVCRR
jgi:hypothetical protein